jgi:hypothetical protein
MGHDRVIRMIASIDALYSQRVNLLQSLLRLMLHPLAISFFIGRPKSNLGKCLKVPRQDYKEPRRHLKQKKQPSGHIFVPSFQTFT